MKKIITLLLTLLLTGSSYLLHAQCYGVVKLDASASAGSSGFPLVGNTSFTITTTQPDDLILIAYDGWDGPGLGPVTVDGNPATFVTSANINNSGTSMVYAYSAPATGAHAIDCSTNGYSTGYYNNFAAAFYCIGGITPLTIASLTSVDTAVNCTTGGAITQTVTTTAPNSGVFATCEVQEGQISAYPFTWTGAIFLANTHTENGNDASDAYQAVCVPGTYTITATNSSPPNNGCGGQTMVFVVIPPSSAASCFSASLTKVNATCGINNGSINISVSGGATPYTYTWSPNVSSSASATGLSSGTYSITVQDATCRDTVMVAVMPSHVPQMTSSITANELCNGFCNGAAMVVVSNGVPPYTYAWAPAGGTTATATGLCAGTYTITTKDSNHCVNSASLTITQPTVLTATTTPTNVLCYGGNTGSATANPSGGTSPYTYAWTNGQTNVTATGLIAGVYSVVVVDNNSCTASASVSLTQPTALLATITAPTISCRSSRSILKANVSGGVPPYLYSWSHNGGTAITDTVNPSFYTYYTFTVTDANGCTDTSAVHLDLGPPLIASISGPSSVCSGNGITLCGKVSGGIGAYTYNWAPVNQTSKCMSDYPTATTTYTMHVVDYCGGDTNITKTILAKPLPKVNFETNFQQGCTPFCIQFHDLTTVASGSEVSWLWSFGDGDSSNAQYPYYCYTSSGTFPVGLTVFSDSGCSATLTILNFITAFSSPVASFSVSPQPTTVLSPKIQFTDKSTDNYGILTWLWNFGDNAIDANGSGNLSFIKDPSHTYSDTGTFCSKLVVMNNYGCTDTTSKCLVIDPIFDLYIPSAFSPESNRNQVFQAKGSYIKSFEMYIFDRWGKQLFHSTNINDGWHGTENGGATACQEDSYVYQIYATDSHNKKHTYQGFVTLLK